MIFPVFCRREPPPEIWSRSTTSSSNSPPAASPMLGFAVAYWRYALRTPTFADVAEPTGFLARGWYFDALYDFAIRRPTQKLAALAAAVRQGIARRPERPLPRRNAERRRSVHHRAPERPSDRCKRAGFAGTWPSWG